MVLRAHLYTAHPLIDLKLGVCWHNREPGGEGSWPLTDWEVEWALLCYLRKYRTTMINVENSLKCHRILRTMPREGRGLSVFVCSRHKWKTYHISCLMRWSAEFIKQEMPQHQPWTLLSSYICRSFMVLRGLGGCSSTKGLHPAQCQTPSMGR